METTVFIQERRSGFFGNCPLLAKNRPYDCRVRSAGWGANPDIKIYAHLGIPGPLRSAERIRKNICIPSKPSIEHLRCNSVGARCAKGALENGVGTPSSTGAAIPKGLA